MRRLFWLTFVALVASTRTADAYVGPGVGAGTVAVVVGVLGSIVLWLLALVWYPFKRMLRRRQRATAVRAPTPENDIAS